MKWSAIITTYNSEQVISRALGSLFALSPKEKPSKVIVVDNASTDGTIPIIETCNFPVHIIKNQTNLGLSKANNIGASCIKEGSIFFLNPDVEILPGAITALYEFQVKHPKAALIGPAMIDENQKRQSTARTWPDPLTIACRRTLLGKTSWGKTRALNHLEQFNSTTLAVQPHWLVGAAMWLTPAGRKTTGLMSEKYFLYFEDVEWCWRAWLSGLEVWFEPKAEIQHVCQRQSTSGGTTLNYHLKSMLRFLLTHPKVLFNKGPGGFK